MQTSQAATAAVLNPDNWRRKVLWLLTYTLDALLYTSSTLQMDLLCFIHVMQLGQFTTVSDAKKKKHDSASVCSVFTISPDKTQITKLLFNPNCGNLTALERSNLYDLL